MLIKEFLELQIGAITNQYKIKSNREAGDGRYDISLIPREKKHPGILMELKWKKGLDADALETLAEDALMQIDDKPLATHTEITYNCSK